MTRAEFDSLSALFPDVFLAIEAADLLLRRRDRRRSAEKRHCEQGGSKAAYDRAEANEAEAAAALRQQLRKVMPHESQARNPDALGGPSGRGGGPGRPDFDALLPLVPAAGG